MSYKYSRYISRVIRAPWAILPEKFMEISELVQMRTSGHKLSDEDIAERCGMEGSASGSYDWRKDGSATSQSRSVADGVTAVIPVHGTIAYRADSFEASSGGTSAELIGRVLKRAAADAGVSTIVLDFNTPGGSVEGIPELAAQIAKVAQIKPVIAHVNALAASAGYWLASQANEIVCTPSGGVGSIGVFMLSIDNSECLAKEGTKIDAISAGKYKLEGASWIPLSAEGRAFMQAEVDKTYREFLSAVATGRTAAKRRTVTVADVESKYAEGRVFDANVALAAGMIDRIATFDEMIEGLAGAGAQATRRGRAATRGAKAESVPAVVAAAVMETAGTQKAEDGVGENGCPDCDPECPCEEPCQPGCPECKDSCACFKAAAKAKADAEALAAEQDALALTIALGGTLP